MFGAWWFKVQGFGFGDLTTSTQSLSHTSHTTPRVQWKGSISLYLSMYLTVSPSIYRYRLDLDIDTDRDRNMDTGSAGVHAGYTGDLVRSGFRAQGLGT